MLQDINLREQAGRIVFANSKLSLEFDRENGPWAALLLHGLDHSLIVPSGDSVDFRIAGQWMVRRHGATLLGYDAQIDRFCRSVTLHLRYSVTAEFTLACCYTLSPGQSWVERSAEVLRNPIEGAAPGNWKLEAFRFTLPGMFIDDAKDCRLYAPGPFWPDHFLPPGMTYEQAKGKTIHTMSAPDAGFGILAVCNDKRNLTVATWMNTGGEVEYSTTLAADADRLTFAHDDQRAYRLTPRMAVASDTQHIEIAPGPLRLALAAYRKMAAETMPLLPSPPKWAHEAIILEAYPQYYKTGLRGLTERLAYYHDVGFNTVYLMPHWKGGYSPIDFYAVDERLGTEADLKAMVAKAHALGMRVLFDMVIHGFNEKSPIIQQRPELFVRDETGQPARHRTWKSISTDWSSPAYHRYMADLARHHVDAYDFDGYRVDAASFKGPGWDVAAPYPAYRSGSNAVELLAGMLAAMREKKPDAILLSEVFGPLFYRVCDLVHDNMTHAGEMFLEEMDAGRLTAADYKTHLASELDALPPGATRVMFARNHDTSWFYHFKGYTPRFMALDAIHAIFAIPEVFSGDSGHPPHPDTDPAVFGAYRKLFALRKTYPELAGGDLLLHEIECDNRMVFAGLRRRGDSVVVGLVSLSDKPEKATIRLTEGVAAGKELALVDVMTGQPVDPRPALPAVVQLQPFQVLVGRIR